MWRKLAYTTLVIAMVATAGVSGSTVVGHTWKDHTENPAQASESLHGGTLSAAIATSSDQRSFAVPHAIPGGGFLITPPPGAVFHQVADRYFDAAGNQIEVTSMTHRVDEDCTSGRRQQSDQLMVHDDGKGNVRFGPIEPATGAAAHRH